MLESTRTEQGSTLFKAAQIPWFQRLSVFRPNPTSILSLTKHRIVSINALRFCRAHRFIVYVHSPSPVPIPLYKSPNRPIWDDFLNVSPKENRLKLDVLLKKSWKIRRFFKRHMDPALWRKISFSLRVDSINFTAGGPYSNLLVLRMRSNRCILPT